MENKSIEEERKELHILINSSTNNIVKSLENIFVALKFDENNFQSPGNIEITENTDSIINEINCLLNIVNKMKFKELSHQEVEKTDINSKNKAIIDSLKKLTEIHENVSNNLIDLQKSSFMSMIKYICNNK
jgi:hypothetical protein